MSNYMKTIIFISHEAKLLGAPKVLLHIIKYFHSLRKYNIIVICPEQGLFTNELASEHIAFIVPESLKKYYRHISQPGNLFLKVLKRIYDNLQLFYYFCRLFKSYSNPIVYANTSVVRYIAFPALFLSIRLLWQVHEFSDNPLKQRFHSFLIKHCAVKIIIHSPYLASRMKLNRQEQRKVIFFRYHTILESQNYNQIVSPKPLYDLIFAGKIGLEKGVLDLLRAIINVIRVKRDLKVVMTGLFIDKDKELILDFVAKNNLDKYITFPGFVPDLNKYILDSKVVVLPTYRDYYPLLLLEAVLLEKPAISTDVGDISSLITHNVNGIIVKPGDIGKLTDAIIRILDESTYNQFIAGAKKKKAEILSDGTDFQMLEQVVDNL